MKTWLFPLLFLALALALAGRAHAQDWKPDPAKSRIGFVIQQMNVPTEGGFQRYAVLARFDPARPEAGQFRVEVDTASIDTGSEEGDDEVKRPAWFDAKKFPKAGFVAKSMKKEGEGRYTAQGDLTIKGITRPFATAVSLTRQGAGWLAQGRFPLKRSTWGIGAGDWNEVVADNLEVRFHLVLLP